MSNRSRHKLNTNITTVDRFSMGQRKKNKTMEHHSCAAHLQPRQRRFLCLCCRCLEFLLQSGATAALEDKQGYRPIHYAAAYGHKHCLELVRTHTQTHMHTYHTHTHTHALHTPTFKFYTLQVYSLHCNQVKWTHLKQKWKKLKFCASKMGRVTSTKVVFKLSVPLWVLGAFLTNLVESPGAV